MLSSLLISLLLSIYAPPVDYDILLAGNFGEPRPHHFHGGLDISTDNVEGKHIYAIGDGYVSRVTQGLYGFGNAVYVTHPEGYTSVYCHLKSFSPRIKAALRRYQYEHQTSVPDARLSPLVCPVSRGQFIALSGNTGNSTGPHLHLEIHDTRTWDMLDPYEFIGDHISDTIPPQAHSLMACPQQGVVCGNSRKQVFGFSSHQLSRELTAWGRVGFALWADDYMQGTYHHYGVREQILMCDGQVVFRALVNRVPVGQNRFVNSWGDYDHWLHHRVWFLKSFVDPGNRLPILSADASRGIIDFCEERPYRLEYILRDYKGNESHFAFTVRGEKPASQGGSGESGHSGYPGYPGYPGYSGESGDARVFHWSQTNSYSLPGEMQLVVPYGLLADDVALKPEVTRRPDKMADWYAFHPVSCPLVSDGELYIRPRLDNIGADSILHTEADHSKLYVRTADGRFMGGEYHDGWVMGRIRDLGLTYTLDYDDEPPTVQPLSLGERIVLRLADRKSGVASFTATIDDRFVVFEQLDKSLTVVCDLSETPLRRTGRQHHLKFSATDNRQNTTVYETNINY